MFHRMPLISATAVTATALIFLLAVLFASSLSSPGAAHADHPGRPTVSIKSVMPEVGEEGRHVTVTLKLSRPLTDDEKYCYPGKIAGEDPKGEVCIEGGIFVWDNYNDHLAKKNTGDVDQGVKFVFRNGEVEKRLTASIPDDQCITPGRTIRVQINQAFDDTDDYGSLIDESVHTIPVNGNDTDNGALVDDGGNCAPVDEGATEEFIANHAPLFTGVSNTRTVDENKAPGQNIGDPVTATDPEDGDILTYLLGGPDGSSFNIDTSTGQLKTKDALNYENKSSYTVTVQVRDSMDIHGDPDMTYDDSIDITIDVTDVNEPPEFDSTASTTLSIAENTAAGEPIGNPITATDPESDTLTYSLDDGDGASFDIDTGTGQIKTNSGLNYEIDASYNVTVSVTDSKDDAGSTDTTVDDTHTVTITVTNVVEPPTFDEEIPVGENSITRTVPENTPAGQPVGDPVSATDEESDTLTYSLGGTDAASFDINASTGQLQTKADLDYEDTQTYSVTVSVADGKDAQGATEDPPSADATIAVTINVTDVNEPPQFADDAPATLSVAETTPAETNIGGPFTATDPDAGETLTYSLDDGDGASFEIDTATGQLKTKSALDHETNPIYTVTVTVTDSRDDSGATEQTPSPDDTHTVTITVTDEDDLGAITFSPEQPIAGTTLTATLTDQDGVQSDDTWQWEISDDQSTWTEITGATTSSFVPGFGDIGNYLLVTVTYTQTDSSTKTVEDETGAILTAPRTNTDASFADLTATRSIPENTPAGQPVGAPVTAEEPDNEDTLTYSLGGTDSGYFEIDTDTGQVKTKADLDYETIQTYSVTVSVTDSKDDYDYADATVDDSIDVTINVTDVNEKPQFDAETAAFTIAEDAGVGQNVGDALTATDDDNDTVTYSVSGIDSALFQVDPNGQLQVKESLDFDTIPTLTVIVSATDGKDDSGTTETDPTIDDTIAVTITLTNIFEPPQFVDEAPTDETSITRTVPENTEADQSVGAPVSATDDEGDEVTYSLGGTDVDSFNFDTTTGQIKTKDALDHEAKEFYSVTVSVHDGKDANGDAEDPAQTDTEIDVTIEVEDVNELPEFIANLPTELSVPENANTDTDIDAPFTATDPDESETLTYGLTGTDAASFTIDETSGQIKTKDDLDYETKAIYSVTVSVRDSRDATGNPDTAADAEIDVTITVTDEDDPGRITLSSQQPPAGETVTATLDDDDGIKTDVEETWVWGSSPDQTSWTTIDGADTNTYIPQEEDKGKYLKVTATYDDELVLGQTRNGRCYTG